MHKQQVYGPSLALLEESVRTSDQSTIHFTGLGLTKSLQEFLVLHYYATDSAASWFDLLSDCFPQVRWPSPGRLRHLARDIFRRIHVAPSHRRAGLDRWILCSGCCWALAEGRLSPSKELLLWQMLWSEVSQQGRLSGWRSYIFSGNNENSLRRESLGALRVHQHSWETSLMKKCSKWSWFITMLISYVCGSQLKDIPSLGVQCTSIAIGNISITSAIMSTIIATG